MILFWDQNRLTVANREPSVEILFYRKRDNQLVFKTSLPYITSRNVDYQNQVCSGLRNLKTVEGTYNAKVSLNPGDFSDPGGYYIVWERCCRNADISNIREPGASGLVFYLEFPPYRFVIHHQFLIFRMAIIYVWVCPIPQICLLRTPMVMNYATRLLLLFEEIQVWITQSGMIHPSRDTL
ncbi:hypothetical protein [Salmonirosea aquatica]|uniref:hypothetical protein n=1 Tax=Salmonirosea aquatica TaxID=2654236 RepID=UPI003570E226